MEKYQTLPMGVELDARRVSAGWMASFNAKNDRYYWFDKSANGKEVAIGGFTNILPCDKKSTFYLDRTTDEIKYSQPCEECYHCR